MFSYTFSLAKEVLQGTRSKKDSFTTIRQTNNPQNRLVHDLVEVGIFSRYRQAVVASAALHDCWAIVCLQCLVSNVAM